MTMKVAGAGNTAQGNRCKIYCREKPKHGAVKTVQGYISSDSFGRWRMKSRKESQEYGMFVRPSCLVSGDVEMVKSGSMD